MTPLTVTVEGSARHIHLTKEALESLFGPGYALQVKRMLSQPGEFLSEEKITIKGPKGSIERVSVLGPIRPFTQVEISFTDARTLGLTPPIRESGSIAGSAGCTLVGPAGSLTIPEGVIIAKRHLHLKPETAQAHGLQNKDVVSVRVEGDRALIFGEVVVRVSPKFEDTMHIDFDEMNAAGLAGEVKGAVLRA